MEFLQAKVILSIHRKRNIYFRADFMHAMENDVKPAFGAAAEVLEGFISRGIINWGEPVQSKSRTGSDGIWVFQPDTDQDFSKDQVSTLGSGYKNLSTVFFFIFQTVH